MQEGFSHKLRGIWLRASDMLEGGADIGARQEGRQETGVSVVIGEGGNRIFVCVVTRSSTSARALLAHSGWLARNMISHDAN